MRLWLNDHIPALRQGNRLQGFADAFRKRVAAEDEYRHIRPQGKRQLHELAACQAGFPKEVQRQEHRGGIARAAAQATACGNALFQLDVHAESASRGLLQGLRGTHGQALSGRHAIEFGDPLYHPVFAAREMQGVGQVDEPEHGLQQVIAVAATPYDMKKEVQLRGRRYIAQLCHGVVLGVMTSRTLITRLPGSERCSDMRTGPIASKSVTRTFQPAWLNATGRPALSR